MAAKRNSPRDKDVSVEPYKFLFESNPHPMWVYDLDTLAFLAVNDAAVRKYGFSRRKFLRMTIADIRPSEDIPKLKDNISRVTDGLDEAGTWRHRKNNGSIIDVEITSHTILWNGRRAELVMAQDVTERKRTQSKIHHLTRLYAVLSQINQAIVRTKNRDDLFAAICNVCVKFGQIRMTWIGLIDQSTGNVKPVAHSGHEKGYLKTLAISTRKNTRSHGPTGTALREGALTTSEDTGTDPHMRPWRTEALKRGYRSSAAVPFRESNKVVGSLNLYASEPGFFSEDEKQLLEEIGANVSFALDAIRAEEERSRAEDALQVSLAKYKTLFDSFPLGITVADGAGKIFETNRIAERLLGISRAEHLRRKIRGKEWRIIRPDGTPMPTEEYASVRALKENRLVENVEMGIVKAPEDVTWISVTAAPLPSDEHGVVITYGDITGRKRAEETRTELSRLLEDSLNEIYVFDADTLRFVHVNRGARNNLGYTMDELHLLTPVDLKPEFNLQRFRKLISPLQTGERQKIIFETKHRRKNSTLYDVEVHLQKGMFEGRPVFVAIIIDITERKRTEEALSQSQQKYQQLIETTDTGYVIIDHQGRVIDANPEYVRLTGRKQLKDILGRNVLEWTAPHDHERNRAEVNRCMQEGRVRNLLIDYITPAAQLVPVEINATATGTGETLRIMSLCRDITKRKRAEEEVRVSQEKFSKAFRSSPDAVTLSDLESGHLIEVNEGFTKVFGYSREETIGRTTLELGLYKNPADRKRMVQILLAQGRVSELELTGLQKSGSELIAQLSVEPIEINGRPCLITTVRDITERRRAEMLIKESEANLHSLINNRNESIWSIDRNYNFITFNTFFRDAYFAAYKIELKKGMNAIEILTPGLHAFWKPKYDSALSGQRVAFEFSAQVGNDLHYFEVTLNPIISDGSVTGVSALSVDITERKRAEEALRESKTFLESIYHGSGVPTAVLDLTAEGNLVFVGMNEAYEGMSGLKESKVIGRNFAEVLASEGITDDATSQALHKYRRCLQARETIEYEENVVLWGQPTWWLTRLTPLRNEGGMFGRIICSTLNITERKRAEEALRHANLIVENGPAVLFRWKAEEGWPVAFVSQNVSQFGYTPEELLSGSTPFASMVHPDDLERVGNEVQSHTNMGAKSFQQEYRIVTKNGVVRWVDDRTVVERNAEGHVTHYQGIVVDITERKRAEMAVLESQLRQKAILNGIPDIAWLKDRESRFIVVNTAFAEASGHTADDLVGKNDFDIWPHELAEDYRKDDIEVLRSRKQRRFEERLADKGGKESWIETIKTPVVNEAGEVVGTTGIARDITERKRAEEALRESQERLLSFVSNAPVVLFGIDANGVFTFSEGKGLQALGLKPGEVVGRSAFEFYREFPGVVKALKGALAGEIHSAFHDMGSWVFDVHYTSLKDEDGRISGLIGVATNITERKRAEEALRHHRDKLNSIFRVAPTGIGVVSNRVLTEVNERICEMTGYTREELLNQNARLLYPSDAEYEIVGREKYDQIRAHGTGTVETRWQQKNGTMIDVLLSSTPIHPEDWSEGITFTALDITDRKQAEAALRNKSAQMEAFMAHAPYAIQLFDREGHSVYANNAFHNLFPTVPPPTWSLFEDAQLLAAGFGPMFERLRRGETINVPPLWFKPGRSIPGESGSERCVTEVAFPLLDSAGQIQQFALIGQDITERKQAEEALQYREKMERIITDISSEFVNLRSDEIERAIHHALERISRFTGADRSYLFFYRDGGKTFDNTHEWCAEGVESHRHRLQGLRVEDFPLVSGPLRGSEAVNIPRVADLPQQSGSDKMEFELEGIQSLVLVPFEFEKVVVGFLGLDAVRGEKSWAQDIVALLRIVGEVFASALERKRAEDALRQSEERLRLALKAANQGLYDLNIQTGEAAVSPEYATMLEYDPDTFHETNSAWIERLHPDDKEPVATTYRDYIAGNLPEYRVEFRQRTRSGGWKWILSVGKAVEHDSQGRPLRMLGTHTDITERKRAEEALRKSEGEYRDLVETMPDGFYRSTRQGRFVYVNPAMVEMLGYDSGAELLSIDIPTQLYPQPKDRVLIEPPNPEYVPETETYQLRKKDGTLIWLEDRCRYLRDKEGNVLYHEGVCRDITDRKHAEEARRRVEERIRQLNEELEGRVAERTAQLEAANKELEAFAYSVSHDLRAPLRAIDGYTRILVEEYQPSMDTEGQRVCSVIHEETKRMGGLIDDLLAFSRLSRSHMAYSEVDMTALAASSFDELTTPEVRGRLKVHVPSLPPAHGDPTLIRQVWTNLLSNAIKFTSKRERPTIEIRGRESGDEVVYSVTDNGAGFDMQYAGKLFGVFQRLHSTKEFEGTGVGLAIVQRIIHRHGGRVWAEGETDRGATFYFTLPLKGAQQWNQQMQ